MQAQDKTKEQLIDEMTDLLHRIAQSETRFRNRIVVMVGGVTWFKTLALANGVG